VITFGRRGAFEGSLYAVKLTQAAFCDITPFSRFIRHEPYLIYSVAVIEAFHLDHPVLKAELCAYAYVRIGVSFDVTL
jgi:hypothetical protein